MQTKTTGNPLSGAILNVLNATEKTGKLFVGTILLLLTIPTSLFATGIREDINLVNVMETAVQGITTIQIEYIPDKIIIRKNNDDKLMVKEYMSQDKQRFYGTLAKHGTTIQIRTGERPISPAFQSCIEVLLPATYQGALAITTTSGKIDYDFDGLISAFQAETTSGGIVFDNLSAQDSSLRSTSGRIAGTILEGPITIENKSGSIQLSRDGEMGDCGIVSTSGKVQLTLPSTARFTYEITTVSGGISIPFPTDRKKDERIATGSVNMTDNERDGQKPYHVSIHNESGSVTLHKGR